MHGIPTDYDLLEVSEWADFRPSPRPRLFRGEGAL